MKIILVILLSVLAAAGQTKQDTAGRNVSLKLPKSAAQNETIWLELKVGVLTRGTAIEIRTAEGRLLGVISPYGAKFRDADAVSIYAVPVPREVVDKGQLAVRLIVTGPNHLQRTPTKRDIRSVRLKVTANRQAPFSID
jgi:hypothetical protein